MNKKEKKAIEDMNRFANGVDMSCVTARQMQIILNLIEKLQKENEEKTTILLAGAEKVKQLEKENEELKEIYRSEKKMKNEYIKLYQDLLLKENVIPIQKVKDKIEELKSNPLKIKQNDKYYYETHAYNKIIISVLQELIEVKEV